MLARKASMRNKMLAPVGPVRTFLRELELRGTRNVVPGKNYRRVTERTAGDPLLAQRGVAEDSELELGSSSPSVRSQGGYNAVTIGPLCGESNASQKVGCFTASIAKG